MPYDPYKHHRHSIRHPRHDYSRPGAYFVTVCTQWRACVFNDPALAMIGVEVWRALPGWFPTIALDEFVIMPNHSHFIVWLGMGDDAAVGAMVTGDREGRPYAPPPSPALPARGGDANEIPWDWDIPTPQSHQMRPPLGNVVGAWKSLVSNVYLGWIKKHNLDRQAKFWQRNFYDRIIRDARALEAIRRYIRQNPERWALDPDNPDNIHHLPAPNAIDDYFLDIKRSL